MWHFQGFQWTQIYFLSSSQINTKTRRPSFVSIDDLNNRATPLSNNNKMINFMLNSMGKIRTMVSELSQGKHCSTRFRRQVFSGQTLKVLTRQYYIYRDLEQVICKVASSFHLVWHSCLIKLIKQSCTEMLDNSYFRDVPCLTLDNFVF